MLYVLLYYFKRHAPIKKTIMMKRLFASHSEASNQLKRIIVFKFLTSQSLMLPKALLKESE